MTVESVESADRCGGLIDFSNCAEEILFLLKVHGVDYLFLNPGTDSAPLQEAALALRDRGVNIPKIIACSFESVALAAAHGYWQRTGIPQAVFVHVDVGTQNLGAMVHNILRDRAGVLVLAGKTPYSDDQDVPGSRSSMIHWQQDVPDQAGILRSYAKWTFELSRSSETSQVIGRSVQIAAGGIPGLAYLMLSRDVLMDPPSKKTQRRIDRFARPIPAAMDIEALRRIVDLLMSARSPVIITGRLGLGGLDVLGKLSVLGSIPVISRHPSAMLSSSHPMQIRSEKVAKEVIEDSDLLLAIECDVPWVPSRTTVRREAIVVQIDSDPIKANMPLWVFPIDIGVVANGDLALKQLYNDMSAQIRKARNRRADRNMKLNLNNSDGTEEAVRSAGSVMERPTLEDVISKINSVLTPEDIVVLEAVTSNPIVLQSLERLEPGNVCFSGGPGLGWALGASVGVKLASSQRRVLAVVGDGAFMFGVPTSALCLAAEARAPFVTVVLNNDGYRASRLPVYELFPKGASAKAGEVIGTQFIQPPDFSAIARACGAYGRRVDTLSDLLPALQEAFSVLDSGNCAVVDVHLECGG